MEYSKQSLTLDEQADLIISRGMDCDRDDLIAHLGFVGYYRLSGYWFNFKDNDENFKPGTKFTMVWTTYTFDRQFRLLILDAIERVEVYLRSRLAYKLSQANGPFGYLKRASLPRFKTQAYERFISKCEDSYRHSREHYIEHFKDQYGDTHRLPPYWMLVGTMDFGQVLSLFRGAPVDVRNEIAGELQVSAKVLESWLVCLNTVRNICAHHGRLWNRVLGTRPMIPKDTSWHLPHEILPDRMFSVLTILSYVLETIAPRSQWRTRLFVLFESYPSIPKFHLGFRKDWKKSQLWAKWL
jgi:abortive infection bacteriophage resistance protein